MQHLGGTIRATSPDAMEVAANICDAFLLICSRSRVHPEIVFLSALITASAFACSEVSMAEEQFMAYCQEQYRLYRQFQVETLPTQGEA